MGSIHFENTARREWWAVHIEAWQRSGLSQGRYCKKHRLTRQVFARWLRAVDDAKTLQHKPHRKRRRDDSNLCKSRRSIAVQAFWAMHVEALNWSGLTVTHYAAALKISAYSLRRWRDVFEAEEMSVDWRARLHPSALPRASTRTSSAAKEFGVENRLTDAPNANRAQGERTSRRTFTAEQKLAIVLECERPGATVSAVARAYQLATSALFRWRAELGYGRKEGVRLARARVAGARAGGNARSEAAPLVLHELLPKPDGMEAVELTDGRRVFALVGADPEAVRRQVAEREVAS